MKAEYFRFLFWALPRVNASKLIDNRMLLWYNINEKRRKKQRFEFTMKERSEIAAAAEEYERWIKSPLIDQKTREELEALRGKPLEILDRFGKTLEFGTAGLRGTMRAGLNAMNVYVIMRTTQGLADYINEQGIKISSAEKSVVIVYDSRINSRLFAEVSACVLAANGIGVKLYKLLRPTPVASYCVRRFGIMAGIAITASHNPKEYNGYKVFWDDGTQLSVEQAAEVAGYINRVDIFNDIRLADYSAAVSDGRIELLDEECDEGYISSVMEQRLNPGVYSKADLTVVHTPLHGASWKLVPDTLRRCGIEKVYSVEEQIIPDGGFPTVEKPNPEFDSAYTLALGLAERVDADIIIANDPDSDRIGAMIRHGGKYIRLTGNQAGALLLEYLLSHRTDCTNTFAVKTFVTTELAHVIADSYGCEMYDCLTGFKNIGAIIAYNEEHCPEKKFVMGYEESYGYLAGTYARDKDGVVAAMLISEMACAYKLEGKTLIDVLEELYARFGYYGEQTINIEFRGTDADYRREKLMEGLRQHAPAEFFGLKVEKITDYSEDGISDPRTHISMKENVLYYTLEGGNVIVVRPSGTEPKVKLYLLLNGERERIEAIMKKGGESEVLASELKQLAYR